MRRTLFRFPVIVATVLLLFAACAKNEPEPEDPDNPVPVNPDPPFFRWSTSASGLIEADSAHAYVNSNVIFAFKNSIGSTMEVRLSSMNTGTYAINAVSGNQLEYQSGSTLYTGSGSFVITESTGADLSGNFSCTLSGGTLSAISGSFDAIPKRYN